MGGDGIGANSTEILAKKKVERSLFSLREIGGLSLDELVGIPSRLLLLLSV